MKKNEHTVLLWGGAAVAGIAAVAFLTQRPQTQTQAGRSTRPATQPNPQNASIEQSLIAARENALEIYDQSAVTERSTQAQETAALHEINSQRAIAFNQDATEYKTAGLAADAEESLARIRAQEETTVAGDYQQAQDQQSSQGFWGGLLGGILNFIPGLFGGFNFGSVFSPQGPASYDVPGAGGSEPPVYQPQTPFWP